MPNKDVIVLVRPNWGDVACKYGHYWYGEVKKDALELGLTVIDLEREDARKAPLNAAIAEHDPYFVSGVGHGNADLWTGQWLEELMRVCHGDEILEARKTYLLSCMTARNLGPDIITKGGETYLGYWTSFTWVISTRGKDIPGDKYDKAFYDTSNAICMLINRNAYTNFTKQAVMEQARQWIAWWEQSGDPSAASVITWLINDYLDEDIDPLRHYGVPSRREDAVSHIPVLQVIRPTVSTSGSSMPMKVMLTCPSGCNLSGQKVKIIDHEGITKAEIELTHLKNGVNYSDIVSIEAPSEAGGLGRYEWKAVYEGDADHSGQEASWIIVIFIDVTIEGEVTDRVSGTPVEGADVWLTAQDIVHGVYTDVNGRYSAHIEISPGNVRVTSSFSPHYHQSSQSIEVTEPGTYEVNLKLSPVLWRSLTLASLPFDVTFLIDRRDEVSPGVTGAINGYHLIETPVEVVSGDEAYRFLRWEDGSINPSRLIYMSATKTITAEYEEVGMEVIHKESSIPWTFIVSEEEHGTITKMVEKFVSASPGETKSVKVGVICAVNGKSCDLTGKLVQVRGAGGAPVGEGVIQAWDEAAQCYVTGLISVVAPTVVGEYTWLGEFPRQ